MRLIRCFSFGKVSNSRDTCTHNHMLIMTGICFLQGVPLLQKEKYGKIIPSLTVKFIKTPLKALFYLGFSAVPFRFTI